MDDRASSFLSLLGTNYCATEAEVSYIKDLLLEPTIRLASLQKRIDQLQQQHSRLLRAVQDHCALMAPARRLPMEVMQEIFLRCLPRAHNAIMHAKECPLVLTQICSHWRSIALRTPGLWTSIHVPMPTGMASKAARDRYASQSVEVAWRRAHMITEWLGRSGSRAIDITLHEGHHGGRSQEVYRIILDALMPFSSRWGSLILDAHPSTLAPIAGLPPSSLPLLHTITLCGPHILAVSSDFWRKSGVVRAPKLRNVTIGNITEDFTNFPLPYSQLTTLSLRGIYGVMLDHRITLNKLLKMLASCSNLRYCLLDISSLAGPKYATDAEPERPPTLLPQLSHFVIAIRTGQDEIKHLFNSLEAPSLEHLEIYGGDDCKPPLTFLRGTLFQLKALTLDPRFLTKDDFIACMRECPCLSELELNFMDNNRPAWRTATYSPIPRAENWAVKDEFLTLLTSPYQSKRTNNANSSLLLPTLSTFKCHVFTTFSDSCILAFIEARISTLKLVHIQRMHEQKPSIKSELEKLCQNGIECEMPCIVPRGMEKMVFPPSEGIVGPGFYKNLVYK